MEQAKKALNWLVKSSADPEQLALTVKAGLPFVILALSLGGLKLDEGEALATVHALATAITALVTLYGLVRKVALTIKAP